MKTRRCCVLLEVCLSAFLIQVTSAAAQAVGGRKSAAAEKAVVRVSALRIAYYLISGAAGGTAALQGLDRTGARLLCHCRPSVQALTLSSGSLPPVVMMQTADERQFDHLPNLRCLHRPRDWTVTVERSMRAYAVIIIPIAFQKLP